MFFDLNGASDLTEQDEIVSQLLQNNRDTGAIILEVVKGVVTGAAIGAPIAFLTYTVLE